MIVVLPISEGICNNPPYTQISSLSLDNGWLSGFMDARSSYSVVIAKSKVTASGFEARPQICITNVANLSILFRIYDLFMRQGIGPAKPEGPKSQLCFIGPKRLTTLIQYI
jgi:hypothetical protein